MKNLPSPIKAGLYLIVALTLLLVTGCVGMASQTSAETRNQPEDFQTELFDFIRTEMKSKSITGLAIAVADSEGILWSEGFGLANKKGDIPFSDETVSNIGSVSKLITATAIMELVEEGKIDLDAPVSAYIPEFNPRGSNPAYEAITVRMLLNHQSGLESDGFYDFFLGYERPADFTTTYRRAIEAVNQCGIVREPYTIFSYCNLGYSLLGIIIERVQGKEFQEAVKELVLTPTGMNNASFILDEAPSEKLAMGYAGSTPHTIPYIRDIPAGSLNSSAKEMGYFLQNMLGSYNSGEGLLQKNTIREMFQPSNEEVPNDLDFRIGLTWWIVNLESLPGEFIAGHGGDLPPYHAMAVVLPERDLAVFVMVNSIDGVGSFSLADIVSRTVRTFAETKGQAPIAEPQEKSPIVPAPDHAERDLPGYYATPNGLSEIRSNGEKFRIFAFNRWLDAYYHRDGTLTLGMKLLGLFPLKLPVFDELSISTERLGSTPAINLRLKGILLSPCIKIEPEDIDQAWIDRSGTYESIHTETMPQYTGFKLGLDKRSGFFCLYLKSSGGWSKYPVQTESSTTARLMGIGRGLGGTIEVKMSNGREILSFQNFKLRGI